MKDDNHFRKLNEEDAKIYFSPFWSHYIALVVPPRPGVALFSTILEYKFFPPNTEENTNFRLLTIRWPEIQQMIWFVISIPTIKISHADATAKFVGLEPKKDLFPVIYSDGSIIMTGSMSKSRWENELREQGWEIFPLRDGINFYTMENAKESPIHQGHDWKELFENEKELVDKIITDEIGSIPEPNLEEIKKWKEYMLGKN